MSLFIKYIPFKYAELRDILGYLEKGGWCGTSDFKSGYHALLLHPDLAEFCRVHWKGVVYVWRVAAFGIAHVPITFSEVVRLMFQPLREVGGISITAYLDDRFSGNMDRTKAKWEALVQYALMAACGWFLTPGKGCLAPRQVVEFLGLEVDLVAGRFRVPEGKLGLLLNSLDRLLTQEGEISRKELASVAGKLVATTLAVPLAPLLVRGLYEALRGGEGGRGGAGPNYRQRIFAVCSGQAGEIQWSKVLEAIGRHCAGGGRRRVWSWGICPVRGAAGRDSDHLLSRAGGTGGEP